MSDLETLSTRFWDLTLENNPTQATLLSDYRFDHLLDDVSPEALDRYAGQLRDVIEQASNLDPSGFDHQEKLTRDMLIVEARNALTMIETRIIIAACDPLTGPVAGLLMAAGQTAAQSGSQAEALYERYRQIPRFLTQALDLHNQETAAGRTQIAANVRRVLSQIDEYLGSPVDSDPIANTPAPDDWPEFRTWRDNLDSSSAVDPA